MYDVVITVMDVVFLSFWGWCLYRFCGSFLVLRRPGLKRGKNDGEIVSPESRGNFFRNGWPMWCFWSGWKWLLDLLAVTDYNIVHALFKIILLYGVLLLFLHVFYEGRKGALLFSFVTFTAVSEISRFLAYSVSSPGTWLLNASGDMLEEGRIVDLEMFLRLIKLQACCIQILMNAVFMLCLGVTLNRVNRAFQGRKRVFDRVELKFLLLPGCTAAMFCVLLRIIMVTVEGQMPSFMFDKYPLLMGVVPVLLVLCLCSVLYSVRLFCELRDLHEEKNRSVILGQQMESMEEHLRETERVYAGVRAMKHDMKNQLAVVAELAGQAGTQTELQTYLTQLNLTLSRLDFPCRTGSAVVDTLVGIKFHEMRERIPGILFQVENLLVPPDLEVSPMDLSLILGNGLDNAIEACERLVRAGRVSQMEEDTETDLEDGAGAEHPWIRVGTGMQAPCFLLKIANSFDGRLKHCAGQEFPETLKAEGSLHGIGLQSIKSTALKYQGCVDWRVEEGAFILTVMLKSGTRRYEDALREDIEKGL